MINIRMSGQRCSEKIVEIEEDFTEHNSDRRLIYYLLRHKDIIECWTIFIVFVVLIFTLLIDLNYVSSGSMEPTLMTGDIQISSKIAYVFDSPQRGDIISFYSKEREVIMGKRVIGIEGDIIDFFNGYVYINGEQLDESAYIDDNIKTYANKSYEVPAGCVFVLGDNREYSRDSRLFNNPYIDVRDIRDRQIICLHTGKL